jgi:hypothetical protein
MAHPIIGVWTAEVTYEGRFRIDRFTSAFHADGTLSISASDGSYDGAWIATGDGSAKLIAARPVPQGEGFGGWFTIRGAVDSSVDGATFTMRAVSRRPRPSDGFTELLLNATGERLTLDASI